MPSTPNVDRFARTLRDDLRPDLPVATVRKWVIRCLSSADLDARDVDPEPGDGFGETRAAIEVAAERERRYAAFAAARAAEHSQGRP